MAGLSIEGARKSFGATEVLKGVSIDVADGEFTVIVGPSGCGKSTLLRAVAGLEELTAGRIIIGARDVTSLAPSERGIAMVFQSYAQIGRANVCHPVTNAHLVCSSMLAKKKTT